MIIQGRDKARTVGGTKNVRVLARGLAILKSFEPANEWRTNAEISVATGLPKPTVSRITANLTETGYLRYSSERAAYRLSISVLTLGFVAASNQDMVVLARPLMQSLADRHQVSVVLAAQDGEAMVCHEVAHSRGMLFTLRVQTGSRLRIGPSALGQALIGSMGDAERDRFLNKLAGADRGRLALLRKQFEAAIVQMSQSGYCVALGTLERGTHGVAIVIDTPDQPHAYALGCAAPANTLDLTRIEEEVAPSLLQIKDRLESELNSSATSPF